MSLEGFVAIVQFTVPQEDSNDLYTRLDVIKHLPAGYFERIKLAPRGATTEFSVTVHGLQAVQALATELDLWNRPDARQRRADLRRTRSGGVRL